MKYSEWAKQYRQTIKEQYNMYKNPRPIRIYAIIIILLSLLIHLPSSMSYNENTINFTCSYKSKLTIPIIKNSMITNTNIQNMNIQNITIFLLTNSTIIIINILDIDAPTMAWITFNNEINLKNRNQTLYLEDIIYDQPAIVDFFIYSSNYNYTRQYYPTISQLIIPITKDNIQQNILISGFIFVLNAVYINPQLNTGGYPQNTGQFQSFNITLKNFYLSETSLSC